MDSRAADGREARCEAVSRVGVARRSVAQERGDGDEWGKESEVDMTVLFLFFLTLAGPGDYNYKMLHSEVS